MKVEIKYTCTWSKLESKSKSALLEIWTVSTPKAADCNTHSPTCTLKLNIIKFTCT